MPTRAHADHEAIKAAYDRLKIGSKVADELGLHPNTVYQVLRRFHGKCRSCSVKVYTGAVYCKACKAMHADRARQKRKLAARNGTCAQCNRRRDPLSRQYCKKHRLEHLKRNTAHKARKRGTPKPGQSPESRRLKHLREKYGEPAVKRWHESGGNCHICNISNNEISVQIHHVDCDETNHAYENLICLCFKCHGTLHRILSLQQPGKLLIWMTRVYGNRLRDWPIHM